MKNCKLRGKLNPFILVIAYICSFPVMSPDSIAGQLYKWTDENGEVHYSQFPPEAGKKEKAQTLNIKIPSEPVKEKQGNKSNDTIEAVEGQEKMTLEEYCEWQAKQHSYPPECKELQARQADVERARKKEEDMRKQAEREKEYQKQRDKHLVARCKGEGRSFCDQSPDGIRLCYEFRMRKIGCSHSTPYYPGQSSSPSKHSTAILECTRRLRREFEERGAKDCW